MIKRGPHQRGKPEMKKPITILSVLAIAALTMGVALAERMGQRAQADRFSFGTEATFAAE